MKRRNHWEDENVDGAILNQEGLGKLIAYFIFLENEKLGVDKRTQRVHTKVSFCFSITSRVCTLTDRHTTK
jgi:type I site-specific restriction-modification system R (restriction) subunit